MLAAPHLTASNGFQAQADAYGIINKIFFCPRVYK
jgi:hypothetical protein